MKFMQKNIPSFEIKSLNLLIQTVWGIPLCPRTFISLILCIALSKGSLSNRQT